MLLGHLHEPDRKALAEESYTGNTQVIAPTWYTLGTDVGVELSQSPPRGSHTTEMVTLERRPRDLAIALGVWTFAVVEKIGIGIRPMGRAVASAFSTEYCCSSGPSLEPVCARQQYRHYM